MLRIDRDTKRTSGFRGKAIDILYTLDSASLLVKLKNIPAVIPI